MPPDEPITPEPITHENVTREELKLWQDELKATRKALEALLAKEAKLPEPPKALLDQIAALEALAVAQKADLEAAKASIQILEARPAPKSEDAPQVEPINRARRKANFL